MTTPQPLVAVTLSRSELLLISALLKAPALMGVEATTADENQRALELLQAEHSLRARNAAAVDENGQLLVVRDLLGVVASCAYPQRSLVVYHTRADGVVLQGFGHVRDEFLVVHTVINPEVHNLAQMPNLDRLIETVFQLSDYAANTPSVNLHVDISREKLVLARQLAEQGQTAQSADTLVRSGVSPTEAELLVRMFSLPSTTTVFVTIQYSGSHAMAREYTLFKNELGSFLMTQTDLEVERYQLKGIDYMGLGSLLYESLS